MDQVNADVVNTAAQIKKHFYEEKREMTQRPYRPASRFRDPALWENAAKVCIELQADPFTFVKAAFMFNSVPGGPFPTQLGGKKMRDWVQQYGRLRGLDYKTEIQTLIQQSFAMMATSGRSPRIFLLDETVRQDVIPAFIRCVLAPKDTLVVDKWGRIAASEINGNPKLLKVLQELGCDLSFCHRQ